MADVRITNDTTDIIFDWYNSVGTLFRSKTIKKKNIVNIIEDVQTDTLSVDVAGNKGITPEIRIAFTHVTDPVTADLAALYALVQSYASAGEAAMANGTFTNATLVDGVTTFVLTINHGLNSNNVMIVVRDPAGISELVSDTVVDANNVTVDFGGAIGAGTWTWFAVAQV